MGLRAFDYFLNSKDVSGNVLLGGVLGCYLRLCRPLHTNGLSQPKVVSKKPNAISHFPKSKKCISTELFLIAKVALLFQKPKTKT